MKSSPTKTKKARYDQFGHAGVDPNYGAGTGAGGFGGGFGGGIDLDDILGSVFGGGFGGFGGFGGGTRRANPNAPRRGQISVSVWCLASWRLCTAAKNCKRLTAGHLPRMSWHGCGIRHQPRDLPGLRRARHRYRAAAHAVRRDAVLTAVLRCGGKGQVIKKPCQKCHGTGHVANTKRVEVNIPAGIDDDQSLRLAGLGDAGANGGPAGDLIVLVSVRPDTLFERDGYDVHVTVPITYSQAVTGADVVVPPSTARCSTPCLRGTQSGTVFRLRGKGIQYVNGRGHGDQYAKVVVEIPKKAHQNAARGAARL